jgi:hypothetical protein
MFKFRVKEEINPINNDLKIAQEVVKLLVEHDLQVNKAHYILEIADYLIDSATKLKSGAVYNKEAENNE